MQETQITRTNSNGATPRSAAHARETVGFGPVTPATDIFENDEEYLLLADMPGVDPADLEVQFENGLLRLRGLQMSDEASSIQPLAFERSFSVPAGVDPERIDADLKNGVLCISMKKSERARPRRIAIKQE